MRAAAKKQISNQRLKSETLVALIDMFMADPGLRALLKHDDSRSRGKLARLCRQYFDFGATTGHTPPSVDRKLTKEQTQGRRLQRRRPTKTLIGSGIPRPSKGKLPTASEEHILTLVSAPRMLTSREFAQTLGVSRELINQWQKAGKIIGVTGAKRGLRYPAWQIGPRGKPYSLIKTIVKMQHGDHWAAWRFLDGVVPELGQLGHVALATGRDEEIVEVLTARSYGSFT